MTLESVDDTISYLCAPQFHSPVKRRSDKKVGKIDRAHSTVTADACHWSLMALKHLTDASFTVEQHKRKTTQR